MELFKTGFELSVVADPDSFSLIDVFCTNTVDNGDLSTEQVVAVARTLLEGGDELTICNEYTLGLLPILCDRINFVESSKNNQTTYSLFEYLLSEGVNLQATGPSGGNCLHYLIRAAKLRLPQYWSPLGLMAVRLLLSAGCDPNGLNKVGLAPFDIPYLRKKEEAPLWSVIFDDTPFEAIVIKTTWVNALTKTCVVVVERETSKLPVSDLSIEEWLELKKIKEQAFWSTTEESGDDTGDECSYDSGDESK